MSVRGLHHAATGPQPGHLAVAPGTGGSRSEPPAPSRDDLLAWRLVESERALEELEQYRRALDQHAIVSVTDARGALLHVNDGFCQASGYGRDELIGRTHRLVASGRHERTAFSEMWAAISRGKVWRGELCNRRKDGALRWFSATITPITGRGRSIERYVAVYTDTTESHVARERIAELMSRLAAAEPPEPAGSDAEVAPG